MARQSNRRAARPAARRGAGVAALLALSALAAPTAEAASALPTAAQQLDAVNKILRRAPGALPARGGQTAAPIPEGAEKQPAPISAVGFFGRDGKPLGPDQGLPMERLRAETAGLISAGTTAADVIRAHDALKAALREEGFLFTAVGDPQLAPDGAGAYRVAFPVLGVTITEVEVTPPQAPDGEEADAPAAEPAVFEQIRRIAAPLAGRTNPTLADLERVSLLATDLPGVRRATFVPAPGDGPGLIKLALNVEFDRWNAVLFADNRQSPSLGPILFGAVASLNAWGPYAATTEISAFNSLGAFDGDGLDFSERRTVQLRQRVFFGPDSATAEMTALWSQSEPGDELKPLGLLSEEWSLSAYAEYPMLRTRAFSYWIGAGFEWSNATTEVAGGTLISDDTLAVARLRAHLSQRDQGGYTLASAEARFGLPILGATESDALLPSRIGADASFVSLRLDAERSQRLSDAFSLFGRISAQYAGEPLLSGEQITAGGALFAKAYDPSEASGDYGVMLYAELRHDAEYEIEGESFGLQLYAFADHAELRRHGDPVFGSAGLSSAGAGLRLNYEGAALNLELAQPLSDPLERTGRKDPRFYFSLTQRF